MAIEKTVSEIAEILGVSRQAVNNRVKALAPEDKPVIDDVKQRELMEILVDEKNAEIVRLYEQLKAKDEQLAKKDEQLRVKDVQIAEKDKQLDQQQQLTLQAMNDRDTLKLELEQANEKVQEQESKGFWARVFRR